jgi:hypothetical protein
MKEIRYVLIERNEAGARLLTMGTSYEALTLHRRLAPAVVKLILELLAMNRAAERVEVVGWRPGVALDAAPVLVVARRSQQFTRGLSYEVEGAPGAFEVAP